MTTIIQNKVSQIKDINKGSVYIKDGGNDAAQAAYDAINTYVVTTSSTPSVANLLTLMNALADAMELSTSVAQYNAINNVYMNAKQQYEAIRQGFLSLSSSFPVEELGVTYVTIKADLITALAPVDGEDTIELLAQAIFGVVNVLNPLLTLEALEADLTASLDGGSVADLRASLLVAVTNADANALSLAGAMYGSNSAGYLQIKTDIEAKETLINLGIIAGNIYDVVIGDHADNDAFAVALYNVLVNLGLSDPEPTLSLERMKFDVNKAVLAQETLGALQDNIAVNLPDRDSLDLTGQAIIDGIYAPNALIYNPTNFRLDSTGAQVLLNLQNIRDALMAACDDVTTEVITTAAGFATAILAAVESSAEVSLTLSESDLAGDIAASGYLVTLATNIHDILNGLAPNSLQTTQLQTALYHEDRIISSHPYDLLNDVTTAQPIFNYKAMREALMSAIDQDPVTDAESLTNAILDNIGAGHNLTYDQLLTDIEATIGSGISFNDLQTALYYALDAAPNTSLGIKNALYGDGLIVPANPYSMLADITNEELLMDYTKLKADLMDVCSTFSSSGNSEAFSADLNDVLTGFGITTSLTLSELTNDINASFNQGDVGNTQLLAAAIHTALSGAELNAEAIKSALYANGLIISANPYELEADLINTETMLNLAAIKRYIIAVCDNGSITTAAGFAAAIVAAIPNGGGVNLDVEDLADDITATLATESITLISLAGAIKAVLNTIDDSDLTVAEIKGAFYHEDRIISSNPYEFSNDITAEETILQIIRIRDALITVLDQVTSDNTVSYLANTILNTINSSPRTLTVTRLREDITYTFAEDDLLESPVFDGDVSALAAAISTALAEVTTLEGIQTAVFDADRVLTNIQGTADSSNLLTDLNTRKTYLTNNLGKFNTIAGSIWTNLDNLSEGYNSLAVATAIVNGIGLSSPSLTAAEIKQDIDATGGSLTDLVASLKTALGSANPSSFTSTAGIKAAIYNQFTLATVNADGLTTDLTNSLSGTDMYFNLASNIVTVLTDVYTGDVENVSLGLIAGIRKISDGVYINDPQLSEVDLNYDMQYSATNHHENSSGDLCDAIKSSLNDYIGLGAEDQTADRLKAAIYRTGTLELSNHNTGLMLDDVNAAIEAGYSFTPLKASLIAAFGGTYASDLEAAQAVLDLFSNGNDAVLTAEDFAADITASGGWAALFPNIVNLLNIADTDAESIRDAIYAEITLAANNANTLQSDLSTYAGSRVGTFYGNIAAALNAQLSNYAETSDIVGALELESPTWTIAEVDADLSKTGAVLSLGRHYVIDNLTNALSTYVFATDVTAENIVNSFYNHDSVTNLLTPATTNTDALLAGLGTISQMALSFGQMAVKIHDSLSSYAYSSDVAAAIVNAVNDQTPTLTADLLTADIDYTLTMSPYGNASDLPTLVDAIKAVATSDVDSASGIKEVVFHSGRVISSTNNAENFLNDIESLVAIYNSYADLKASLSDLSGATASDILASIKSNMQLPTYTMNEDMIEADIDISANGDYNALVNVINGRVSDAVVSDVATASANLAAAFYNQNALTPANMLNLEADIISANNVDDIVTDRSAIGTNGLCTEGATHVVYSCSMVSNVLTVGSLIARNDCTITGKASADSACYAWANQPGVDLHASYTNDNNGCTEYLGAYAATYCLNGLDHVSAG